MSSQLGGKLIVSRLPGLRLWPIHQGFPPGRSEERLRRYRQDSDPVVAGPAQLTLPPEEEGGSSHDEEDDEDLDEDWD